jgi:uncharacterized protein (TIGR03118 family)
MKTTLRLSRVLGATACASIVLWIGAGRLSAQTGTYSETLLVTDVTGLGQKQDPNLSNPWGLAADPGAPWWVSDNNSGLSTLYDGQGNIESLVVTIPPSASDPTALGSPTGIVANSTTDFGGSFFIFDTEDGTISAWSGAPSASIVVDKGTAAVYKGLAMGQMNAANVLYAADFRTGTIDVYDANFNAVTLAPGAFTDSKVPADWAPLNVQVMNGHVFVMFAKQDSAKHDQINGAGLGQVDEFTSTGDLVMRFEHGDYLNAPWGAAIAPSDFGKFSGAMLVGNFGSGAIVAYDVTTGKALGLVDNVNGKPLVIPGLWALDFGLGGSTGPANWLYFTAGPKNQTRGLFGYLIAN